MSKYLSAGCTGSSLNAFLMSIFPIKEPFPRDRILFIAASIVIYLIEHREGGMLTLILCCDHEGRISLLLASTHLAYDA